MFHVEQLPCWITSTNPQTHDLIRANLDKSPLYAGRIEGVGPRYCPSIEDKVVRFAEKKSHQIFLEPEGRHTEEYYVNGVSTSLPMEVQYAFIRSIPGLENAEIMRPGYAVEYDYCPPTHSIRPWRRNRSRISISPARSMAPPATRKPVPRDSWPGPTPHSSCSTSPGWSSPGPTPILASSSTIS